MKVDAVHVVASLALMLAACTRETGTPVVATVPGGGPPTASATSYVPPLPTELLPGFQTQTPVAAAAETGSCQALVAAGKLPPSPLALDISPARPRRGEPFEVTGRDFPPIANVGILAIPAEDFFAGKFSRHGDAYQYVIGETITGSDGLLRAPVSLSAPGRAGTCYVVMARTFGFGSTRGPDGWATFEYAGDFMLNTTTGHPSGCVAYMMGAMPQVPATVSASRIWLTPVTGPPGTWTTLRGTGLSPGQRVDVRLHFAIGNTGGSGASPLVRRMVVDNLGMFSLRVRFPVKGKCLGITASAGSGTGGGGLWIPTGPDQPRPKPDRCEALDALGFAFEGGEEASDLEAQQRSVTMTPRAVASGAAFHVRVTGLYPSTSTRMYISIRSSDRGGWGTPVAVGTTDASGQLEADVVMPHVPEADGRCSYVVFSTIRGQADERNVQSEAFDYVLR